MKGLLKISITLVLLLASNIFYAQQSFELSIKEGTKNPIQNSEHIYLLEVKNNSKSESLIRIQVSNASCKETENLQNRVQKRQVNFNQQVLNKNLTKNVEQISLKPNETYQFYIKITRPNGVAKKTWNCTEVIVISDDGKSISNNIVIESYVPEENFGH